MTMIFMTLKKLIFSKINFIIIYSILTIQLLFETVSEIFG